MDHIERTRAVHSTPSDAQTDSMARVLIYVELVLLILLSAASLTDARMATLPVYLSPALVVGSYFSNLVISGSILWLNSLGRAERTARCGHERDWSVPAAWILGAATIFAMWPLVS
jgi:prepilin signal peptidase PulO-like enzyme (type II secretory pathway)